MQRRVLAHFDQNVDQSRGERITAVELLYKRFISYRGLDFVDFRPLEGTGA